MSKKHFVLATGRHEVGHIEDTSKDPLNGGNGCRFVAKFQVNKGEMDVNVTWRHLVFRRATAFVLVYSVFV